MFSGLTNQISGMVAQRMGKAEAAAEEAAGDQDGAAEAAEVEAEAEAEENGEEEVLAGEEEDQQQQQQQKAGGLTGMAQGLMARAMSAKEGIREKASGFSAGQVKGMGLGIMHNVQNLIPGRCG